jgi:hypothetical protein
MSVHVPCTCCNVARYGTYLGVDAALRVHVYTWTQALPHMLDWLPMFMPRILTWHRIGPVLGRIICPGPAGWCPSLPHHPKVQDARCDRVQGVVKYTPTPSTTPLVRASAFTAWIEGTRTT